MSYASDESDEFLLRAIAPDAPQRAEPGDDPDAAAMLARIGRAVREGVRDDAPEAPPESVWAAIEAKVAADIEADPASVRRSTRAGNRRPSAHAARRDRARWLAGAAAAAVIAIVFGVFVLGSNDADSPTPMASATLDPLSTRNVGTGEARLVRAGDMLELDIDVEGVAAPDGEFLEVWLIDRQVRRLVSLGPVRPDGVYDVPAGLDPNDYPVVDVSAEPLDGQPTHSGTSLLRGMLTF